MRYALIADVHANLEALQAVLRDVTAQGVDRVVCLGDLVGYNADPGPCLELVAGLEPIWVAGNHDRAVTGQIGVEGFNRTAVHAVEWTRRRLSPAELALLAAMPLRAVVGADLVAVHGAWHPETGCETVRLDNDDRRRLSLEALASHPTGNRICAFGHTHRVGIFEWRGGPARTLDGDEVVLEGGAYYLVNPGTVGQPRTMDRRATYMVLDTTQRRITVRRVAYHFAAAFRKSGRAGLLPRFSFLPAPVRASLKRYAQALGLSRPS